MRRFHDCLDVAIEKYRGIEDEEQFRTAVLEQLADVCRQMGLPQAFAARVDTRRCGVCAAERHQG